jgi:superfamily II DNA/RNA helicase
MVKMQETFSNKKKLTTSSDEEVNDESENKVVEIKKTQDEINGSFDLFNLPKELVNKLKIKGFKHLLPIQVSTLEIIRNGNDLIAQSRTGTGKTMAFAIPLVEKLLNEKKLKENDKSPKILILAPTRELAKQVGDDFK